MATESIQEHNVLQHEEDYSHVEDYEDDEAEETLSLSDLPLHSNTSINHHAASAPANHSHRRHQEDFEFFSEDFTASTRRAPPESIIFCGKIIHPYRETNESSSEKSRFEKKNLEHSGIGIFQWRSDSWDPKSKGSKVVKTSVVSVPQSKYQISVEKVSVPNNKWYLFKFGLRDKKTRQSGRRSTSGLWGLLTSLRCKTSRYLAT